MTARHPLRQLGKAIVPAGALAGLLASCTAVPPAAPPQQTPRAEPSRATPAPAPRPVAGWPVADWQNMPATPGDWTWANENGRSTARFGAGLLTLACDRAARQVVLSRSGGSGSGSVAVTVQTTFGRQARNGQAVAGPPPTMDLRIAATDPLLDAIAFSRGRFAIEAPGQSTLFVPSWPEIGRVIEDCR